MATKKGQKNGNGAISDIPVTAKQLGELLGVGERMVRHLAEEGVAIRQSTGKYLLLESAHNYISLLKAQKNGLNGGIRSEDTEYDLREEQAAHEHLKKQITEIKLMLVKGQVHKAEDVASVMTDIFAKIKSKLEAMPAKLARKLEGKGRTQIQQVLKDEVSNALLELSSYNPADFYSDEHIEIDGEKLNALGITDEGEEG